MADLTAPILTTAAMAALMSTATMVAVIVVLKFVYWFETSRHREALHVLLRRLFRSPLGRYGMDGIQRPRMDEDCLAKMKVALDGYSAEIERSDLAQSTKVGYITQADNFIRWCEGKHTPGGRESP